MKNVSNLDIAAFGTRKACAVTCLHTNKGYCMALWYILFMLLATKGSIRDLKSIIVRSN